MAATDQDGEQSLRAVVARLSLESMADMQEAATNMRLLARDSDRRLWERIWHFEIEPLEQEIERQLARWRVWRNPS
jgi:hypothetical protein